MTRRNKTFWYFFTSGCCGYLQLLSGWILGIRGRSSVWKGYRGRGCLDCHMIQNWPVSNPAQYAGQLTLFRGFFLAPFHTEAQPGLLPQCKRGIRLHLLHLNIQGYAYTASFSHQNMHAKTVYLMRTIVFNGKMWSSLHCKLQVRLHPKPQQYKVKIYSWNPEGLPVQIPRRRGEVCITGFQGVRKRPSSYPYDCVEEPWVGRTCQEKRARMDQYVL